MVALSDLLSQLLNPKFNYSNFLRMYCKFFQGASNTSSKYQLSHYSVEIIIIVHQIHIICSVYILNILIFISIVPF